MLLTSAQHEAQRQSLSVYYSVNLGRQPAAGTSGAVVGVALIVESLDRLSRQAVLKGQGMVRRYRRPGRPPCRAKGPSSTAAAPDGTLLRPCVGPPCDGQELADAECRPAPREEHPPKALQLRGIGARAHLDG